MKKLLFTLNTISLVIYMSSIGYFKMLLGNEYQLVNFLVKIVPNKSDTPSEPTFQPSGFAITEEIAVLITLALAFAIAFLTLGVGAYYGRKYRVHRELGSMYVYSVAIMAGVVLGAFNASVFHQTVL